LPSALFGAARLRLFVVEAFVGGALFALGHARFQLLRHFWRQFSGRVRHRVGRQVVTTTLFAAAAAAAPTPSSATTTTAIATGVVGSRGCGSGSGARRAEDRQVVVVF